MCDKEPGSNLDKAEGQYVIDIPLYARGERGVESFEESAGLSETRILCSTEKLVHADSW